LCHYSLLNCLPSRSYFYIVGVVIGGIGLGVNCDCFGILYSGDMDCMGVFLLFVVIYMLLFTTVWCSVDIGDYYVFVNGHVLSCMCRFIFYSVVGLLVLSLLLLFTISVVVLDFTVSCEVGFFSVCHVVVRKGGLVSGLLLCVLYFKITSKTGFCMWCVVHLEFFFCAKFVYVEPSSVFCRGPILSEVCPLFFIVSCVCCVSSYVLCTFGAWFTDPYSVYVLFKARSEISACLVYIL
jgi:hypothetical protein